MIHLPLIRALKEKTSEVENILSFHLLSWSRGDIFVTFT